jgi:hypothetical protein
MFVSNIYNKIVATKLNESKSVLTAAGLVPKVAAVVVAVAEPLARDAASVDGTVETTTFRLLFGGTLVAGVGWPLPDGPAATPGAVQRIAVLVLAVLAVDVAVATPLHRHAHARPLASEHVLRTYARRLLMLRGKTEYAERPD